MTFFHSALRRKFTLRGYGCLNLRIWVIMEGFLFLHDSRILTSRRQHVYALTPMKPYRKLPDFSGFLDSLFHIESHGIICSNGLSFQNKVVEVLGPLGSRRGSGVIERQGGIVAGGATLERQINAAKASSIFLPRTAASDSCSEAFEFGGYYFFSASLR